MSEFVHIVYVYNCKTIQQKYTKDRNEENIASAPKREERKTQEN